MKDFEGFRDRNDLIKNYTSIPNELFDQVMRDLSNSELKILLALFRKTYGWVKGVNEKGVAVYKSEDEVSQSQFMELTGIKSRKTIRDNLESLVAKGYIVKIQNHDSKVGKGAVYGINKINQEEKEKPNQPDETPGTKKEENAEENNVDPGEEVEKIYNQLDSKWLTIFKKYIDIYRLKNKTEKITDSRHLKLLEELFEIFKTKEFDFDGQEYELTKSIFKTGINKIIKKDVDNLNYAKQVWIGEIEKKNKKKKSFNSVPDEFEAYDRLSS